jgi:hypothetical protein
MRQGQTYGAYTRPSNAPSADLSRAMFGVLPTPLPELLAPTLERLPGDIGAQLKRDFWKRHNTDGEWSTKYAAQEWLATEVAEFEREKIHRAFDEPEITALAKRWSDLCARMVRLEPMQDFARSVGIEPPEVHKNVTRVGAARRLSCPRWWRRQIRKSYLRRAETHLRARGFVHRRRQVYASDRAVDNRRQRKARDRALLEELQAVSDAGDQLNLWDVVAKSQANPALRRAELMTRLRGFEEVAQLAGHVAEFITLTCPSAYHRTHDNGTQNERWEGFSPREGQGWLCKMWARVRAKLKRVKVMFYGFRIAEPHHDATPHWHAVLFVPSHHADALRAVVAGIWLAEYGDEPGAARYRSKFVRIDPTKGSACGYVAKYIAKNIDGFEVGDDHETEGKDAKESCDRVAAWASAHGIRQFQQIGGPPVTVWRELRRIRVEVRDSATIEAARKAADSGEWAAFIAALGSEGGKSVRTGSARASTAVRVPDGRAGEAVVPTSRNCVVRVWTEVTGELSQYEELRGPQIAGVQAYERDDSGRADTSREARRHCAAGSRDEAVEQLRRVESACVAGVRGGALGSAVGDSAREEPAAASGRCGRTAAGDGQRRVVRVRTRCKVWRIQRKASGQRADALPGHARTCGIATRTHDSPGNSGPVSSLGPVSITVRGLISVPSGNVAGAHASSIRGSPPWLN